MFFLENYSQYCHDGKIKKAYLGQVYFTLYHNTFLTICNNIKSLEVGVVFLKLLTSQWD